MLESDGAQLTIQSERTSSSPLFVATNQGAASEILLLALRRLETGLKHFMQAIDHRQTGKRDHDVHSLLAAIKALCPKVDDTTCSKLQ